MASWRTIATGALFMNDPVGTELKHGPNAADYMGHTFDLFQRHLNMQMLHVKANGPEMAWVIESRNSRYSSMPSRLRTGCSSTCVTT